MMSFTVDVTDEIWNAFVDAYGRKRGTTSTTYYELQNETHKVMRDAIKAYAMSSNDEPKEEQDSSVMIPVHDWIWQDFKWAYTKRNKGKKDDELIEVVHDWACRAMQYYTRYNMDDPWRLVEAYEIALSCPDIQLQECKTKQGSQRTWNITVQYPEYNAYAVGVNDLYHKLNTAKEYVETLKKKEPRSTRDMIHEAVAIAKSVPGMLIANLRDGGWAICLDDGDYSVEAKTAEQLLAEVKAAKAYREASQKPKKKNAEQTREMIREAMEKAKIRDEGVIHIDGLDQETKELLLYFIETLTIKEASDILAKEYPCSVWDELHFIREKLRKSIELQGSRR